MNQSIDRDNISKAELARRMKVSRARITQIMNLLKLSPDVIEMIKGMGDNFTRPVINERRLRGVGGQMDLVKGMLEGL